MAAVQGTHTHVQSLVSSQAVAASIPHVAGCVAVAIDVAGGFVLGIVFATAQPLHYTVCNVARRYAVVRMQVARR